MGGLGQCSDSLACACQLSISNKEAVNARLLFIEVCTVLVRLYGPYSTPHQRCIIWTTQMCEHSADINAQQPSINTGEFLAFITLLITTFRLKIISHMLHILLP